MVEITRKCNKKCPHCMRGEAQDVTISEELIDKLINETEDVLSMSIGGGEALLEIERIQSEIYEEFTYHALRHTHASKLYEAGLNEKFISERMGHKDDRVTRAVYIHLTDQSREQGREAVNQIYNALDY